MIVAAREAVHDDVAILALLAGAAADEKRNVRGGPVFLQREAPGGPHEARLASAIDADERLVLCGTIDDTVVGFATMQCEVLRNDDTIGRIDELFVLPEARGVAVGEHLMEALVERAHQWGCRGLDAVALPGDRETKNFFETFGLKARAILVHRSLD